jgi:flagellar motility protein MotE (MotC chaperone)
MENKTEAVIESSSESYLDRSAVIKLCVLTSSIVVVLFLVAFTFLVKKEITANQLAMEQSNIQIADIKQSLNVSRTELEKQVKDYIDTNYGVLSERDEKVDKLVIYFRQQDARLSNIEKALSEF